MGIIIVPGPITLEGIIPTTGVEGDKQVGRINSPIFIALPEC